VVGCCECGNETSGSVKCREILDCKVNMQGILLELCVSFEGPVGMIMKVLFYTA
jgi:hypothetical protein